VVFLRRMVDFRAKCTDKQNYFPSLLSEVQDPISCISAAARGNDKSLARHDWKNNWKLPFFFRPGGHCCHGELVGRKKFWIFFEWLAKTRFWSL